MQNKLFIEPSALIPTGHNVRAPAIPLYWLVKTGNPLVGSINPSLSHRYPIGNHQQQGFTALSSCDDCGTQHRTGPGISFRLGQFGIDVNVTQPGTGYG